VFEAKLLAAFTPEVYATDEALRLVLGGMPFRDAYRQVGASLDKLENEDPRAAVALRTHAGGSANLRLELADEAIKTIRASVDERRDRLRRTFDDLLGTTEPTSPNGD